MKKKSKNLKKLLTERGTGDIIIFADAVKNKIQRWQDTREHKKECVLWKQNLDNSTMKQP